jgi:hypothetical protein
MEPVDCAIDASMQDPPATSDAVAAAALQVLAAQPTTDTGQFRCIYRIMPTLAHR